MLSELPPEVAQRIEAALAARDDSPTDTAAAQDSLVVSETYARLQHELADNSYYRGEVKGIVDKLTLLLFLAVLELS